MYAQAIAQCAQAVRTMETYLDQAERYANANPGSWSLESSGGEDNFRTVTVDAVRRPVSFPYQVETNYRSSNTELSQP